MKFKKIELREYLERLPYNFQEAKTEKSYLEQCLEDGTAEYYIIKYEKKEYEFFFYIYDEQISLCLNEKSTNSIFDNSDMMKEIFKFLKSKKYHKIVISLLLNSFIERHELALEYGFVEKMRNDTYIEYEKEI